MKTKFSFLSYSLILLIAVSLSLPRAIAQNDNNYPQYDNGNNNNNDDQRGYDNNYDNNGDENYNDNNSEGYNNDNNGDYGNDEYYGDEGRSDAEVDINVFQNELSPYGRWIYSPSYGRAWVYSEPGFRPYYSRGHWAYTPYGWTWVSGYRWGWATFHYGRWVYEPFYGWMWVPGYTWAPAWVAWRNGGGYYGWAPLGPRRGIGVGVSFGYGISANLWMFTPTRYITSPYIGRYCVNRTRNVTIINNTTVINNYNTYNHRRYIAGPRRIDVERNTHQRINVVQINNASRPGETKVNGNSIAMYRPNALKHKQTSNQNINRQFNSSNNNSGRKNNSVTNQTQNDNNRILNGQQSLSQNNNNNGNNQVREKKWRQNADSRIQRNESDNSQMQNKSNKTNGKNEINRNNNDNRFRQNNNGMNEKEIVSQKQNNAER
ncbi:MAG: DUF6600 domain-containing protein, partial [Parafilimonas sp.]